jgi:hypothetical protein
MVVVIASVFASIATTVIGGDLFSGIMVVVFGSLVSGATEVLITPGSPCARKCQQLGKVAGKFFCGLVLFMVIMTGALLK